MRFTPFFTENEEGGGYLMKKNAINISLILMLLLLAAPAIALNVPILKGYVNDYAGMLSAEQASALERDLELNEASTSNQIFILTIPSLEGEVLENFSIKVAESWQAGQKKKDNGVIVILVKNDRKIRIEVGRGLEGTLTDLVSGRIIREEMTPRLKKNDVAGALKACVEKINLAVKGEYRGDGKTAKNNKKEKKGEEGKLYLALAIFFGITGVLGYVHFFIGGVAGAAIAPAIGIFMYHVAAMPIIIGLVILGFLLGLIGRFVFEAGLSVSGGSSSSGSSFGGGGGSFGGGGASGDW